MDTDNKIIIYQTEDGQTQIDVRLESETVWLTQAQMAELCGVSQPTIARMERSTHSPQLDSLFKILVPLGYTLQIVALKSNQ